jgi:ribonuclease Y
MEQILIFASVALVIGLFVGWLLNTIFGAKSLKEAQIQHTKLIEDGKAEVDDLIRDEKLKLKDELFNQKQELDHEHSERMQALKQQERSLEEREADLQKGKQTLVKKETELKHLASEIETEKNRANDMKQHYRDALEQVNKRLEEIAGLSKEDVLEELKANLIADAHQQTSKIVTDIIEEAKDSGHKRAKDIILQTIAETAADHSVESTISIVNLPDDTMKGRIIGREGRNIRSFELNTGVDILIDDTPQVIVLSCFDPVRREIAKVALDRLIEDGRVHPARIEEVVEKAREEMDDRHQEAGEQAFFELGIHGIHGDLVNMVGQLRFRTISGQSALKHSVEVAKIATHMATQLNLDVNLVKRAAIFHELGRIIDKPEVPILERTLEVLRRYKESETVLTIITEAVKAETITQQLAYVLAAAKTLSSSRPGARRETYESYTKRLTNLEDVCLSFDGVEHAYAIQTGREVRILVDTDIIDDAASPLLANKIAKQIEENLEYPGQIKITIHREFRSVDFAK